MNREKIVEIIVEELKKIGVKVLPRNSTGKVEQQTYKSGFFTQKKYIESFTSLPNRKKLITEYDIKQMLKRNPEMREFKLSKDAILGPLAEDFLNSRNIRIIRE